MGLAGWGVEPFQERLVMRWVGGTKHGRTTSKLLSVDCFLLQKDVRMIAGPNSISVIMQNPRDFGTKWSSSVYPQFM